MSEIPYFEYSIGNMTIDRIVEVLSNRMIEDVLMDQYDGTEAETVKAGRLQADPTDGTGISILVHPNHPVDEGYVDEIAVASNGMQFPTYETGGGSRIWRKYTVEYQVFDIGETQRPVTREIVMVVRARIEHILRNGGVCPVGPDDFGEAATFLQVEQSYVREGGGETAFIWRGEVRVRTLNYVEGCL